MKREKHADEVVRRAHARDASHFLIVPREVVRASGLADVAEVMHRASSMSRSITFRSGGTSLSGQAQGGDILVDTRQGFLGIEVLSSGTRVRVGPGVTLRAVNNRLAVHGRRLGPDPASEVAATVGGILANNSSGMSCGTQFNAYNTLESVVVLLASGTVFDSGSTDANDRLRTAEPDIFEGLLRMRAKILSRPDLLAEVARQFAGKNTMGYGLNAFLDAATPADILAKLIVGSEGTLGFIAEATFRTLPLRPHAETALMVFQDLKTAIDVVPDVVGTGAAVVELLDGTSLSVAAQDPRGRSVLPSGDMRARAALLVEFQEESGADLVARHQAVDAVLRGLPTVNPFELTSDAQVRSDLWHVRKGLYAAVAGARPAGTTALLEDIAVPAPQLSGVTEALLELLTRHRYETPVVFGHAKDGNLHFMLSERFDHEPSVRRFEQFTNEMVDLVLGAGGTLKAEHGTGRMMAPFVRRQYGDELFDVMVEIKKLLDPGSILNPGVTIGQDPGIHLRHLKSTQPVEEEVDRCVDCGFCEPVCPSRHLTLTPRQRIAVRRDRAQAEASGDKRLVAALDGGSSYPVLDTCATDGMCSTTCPLGIDTGSLVKRLRREQQGGVPDRTWEKAAEHWGTTTKVIAQVSDMAARTPKMAAKASRVARRLPGGKGIPHWDAGLPGGGTPRKPHAEGTAAAVYVPSCLGTMFGPEPGYPGVSAAFLELCQMAQVDVLIPEGVDDSCCGTPWTSKGLSRGHTVVRDRMSEWLWEATRHGQLPIVTDAASCTEGLSGLAAGVASERPGLRVLDLLTFTAESLVPRLGRPFRAQSLMLHPTCATTRLGLTAALKQLGSECALEVLTPSEWGCCGFAGDRGLLHPELTASATSSQVAEIADADSDLHASANRTCELALTRATGKPYVHVIELLAIAHGLFERPNNPSPKP